jgi:DNA-binding NtrC family response regulator
MKYVLVVDDDKVVNLLITRELQKKGYGVFMSYDAVQAGTTLSRARVHAVIVDVQLIGGSAFDVIQRMKLSTRLGPIPIIAISSGMSPQLAGKLVKHGASRCMKKPLDLDFLQRTLEEIFAHEELQIVHRQVSQRALAGDAGLAALSEEAV